MKASDTYFRVGFYGLTEFRMPGAADSISLLVSIGYRKTSVDGGEEKNLYASFKTPDNSEITLQKLICSCGGSTADIPEVLKDSVGFKEFAINYGSGGINNNTFRLLVDCLIKIDGRQFAATLSIGAVTEGSKKRFEFGGIVSITAEHRFEISFTDEKDLQNPQSGTSYLYASYHKGGTLKPIGLRELGTALFDSATAAELPDLSLQLSNFKAFLLYRKSAGHNGLLLGMGADVNIDLNNMPMAGVVLAQNRGFSFQELLVMYASASFTCAELEKFSAFPKAAVSEGFNIASTFNINNKLSSYMLNSDTAVQDKPAGQKVKMAEVVSLPGETAVKAKWTKIDKKVGPVDLQRLGFIYDKGQIILLLDAAITAGGINVQLMGLGLGFILKWPPDAPDFYIDGLGISYNKDPIKIGGMFARVAPKPIEEYSYYGSAQVSLAQFSISGIGAYSKLKSKEVSFFIYAMYQGAIGGPAFFFVTGIAAGFGYNRNVRIPALKDVNDFPLVQLALNPLPDRPMNEILQELISKDHLPVSPGDYWLALGIKFNSFRIVDSFVLVIVQFGNRIHFTVLGLSILAWPDRNNPIAYVELVIKASFGPDSDVVSVEGMLTGNSFVLDKNCRLSGGFAFYAWVSGPHEGDFVITLGGYHPRFKKPDHYPEVERLGLNWQISSQLKIKGELYYALTPSSIMAGGRLEITYTLSFLRGYIVIWADMVIAWAPFHYSIDMGVRIMIDASIDVGLFTINFHVEIGAELHIWGPQFAGRVYVDWSIFSFTIPFGDAGREANKLLAWDKFKSNFIPAKQLKEKELQYAAEIQIVSGVIHQYEFNGKKFYIVDPHRLSLKVEAVIPLITISVGNDEIDRNTPMTFDNAADIYGNRNQNVGIRPMGVMQLQSHLQISITGNPALVLRTYAANVPEALWSQQQGGGNNNAPDEPRVIRKVLKGLILEPAKEDIPKATPRFDLSGKFEQVMHTLRWQYRAAQTGPDNEAFDAISSIIAETFTSRAVAQEGIMQDIIDQAAAAQEITKTEIDTEAVKQWAVNLNAEPVVVQLGGLPQYKTQQGK